MSKKEFTVTLFPEHMKAIEESLTFHHPDKKDILHFVFDSRPNLEVGDTFKAKLMLEEPKKGVKSKDIINIDAIVLDIAPPMLQPAEEAKFEAHYVVMSKYLRSEVTSKIKSDYFKGEAQKSVWTVYFKKIKQPATE